MRRIENDQILYTKDGRIIGNAIVIGHRNNLNIIKTDYGNVCEMTTEEIYDGFHLASKEEMDQLKSISGDHKHAINKMPILTNSIRKTLIDFTFWFNQNRPKYEMPEVDDVDEFLSENNQP